MTSNETTPLSQSPSQQPKGILKRPGEGKDGGLSNKGDLKIELSKAEEERIDELQKSGGRRQLVRRNTQWKPNEAEEEHAVNKDSKDSSASGSETPKTPKGDNPMKRGGLTSSRGSGTSGEGSRPPTPRSEPSTEAEESRAAEEPQTRQEPLSRTNSGRSTDRSDREKRRAGGCNLL